MFADPKTPVQTCLILSINKHRCSGFLIYGDRHFVYEKIYPQQYVSEFFSSFSSFCFRPHLTFYFISSTVYVLMCSCCSQCAVHPLLSCCCAALINIMYIKQYNMFSNTRTIIIISHRYVLHSSMRVVDQRPRICLMFRKIKPLTTRAPIRSTINTILALSGP